MIHTTQNKMIYLPDNFEEVVKAIGSSIIVKRSMKYCSTVTKGGLILPETSSSEGLNAISKKAEIGEVLAVGPKVEGVGVGDVVFFDIQRAWHIPSADDGSVGRYFKLEANTMDVICILPGDVPDPEKENAGS